MWSAKSGLTIEELDTDVGGWLMGARPDDFAEFVHATGRRIHCAALMLCDHHLAEDLTQTTYLKVHARWSRVSRMRAHWPTPTPC